MNPALCLFTLCGQFFIHTKNPPFYLVYITPHFAFSHFEVQVTPILLQSDLFLDPVPQASRVLTELNNSSIFPVGQIIMKISIHGSYKRNKIVHQSS